jgi:hypothetical protein
MKLFSYVVHHDTGLAPNPENKVCTLVYCKFRKSKIKMPNVIGLAEKGDWIIGTGGKNTKISSDHGTIIYTMRVDEKLSFAEYIRDPRFRDRSRGKKHGKFALISQTFLYFGRKAIPIGRIPGANLVRLEKKGPGFRKDFSEEFIRELAQWVHKQRHQGKIGEPCASDPDRICERTCR